MRVTKKPVRQEYQVAIDKRMPSYLPFSCSPNRKKGWSMFKDLGNGGYCKAVACETINITDIISLLAMVKAFQDMPGKVRMSDVMFGDETKVLASLKMKHTDFLKRYIKHNNGAVLVNTLTRLLTYKVIWQGQKKNGRKGALDTTIFLYDFKISEAEHEITFLVAKGMLDYCQSNGWLVNLDKIQTLKSNAAQILALHFSTQQGGKYRQETLELVADLHSPQVDNRKILKKALTELQEGNFIGGFSAEKDKSGYLYTIEHLSRPLPESIQTTPKTKSENNDHTGEKCEKSSPPMFLPI